MWSWPQKKSSLNYAKPFSGIGLISSKGFDVKIVNNINPRDLHKLASSVVSLPDVLDPLYDKVPFANNLPTDIPLDEANKVLLALVDEPPTHTKDGGIFRKGYNKELDEIVEWSTIIILIFDAKSLSINKSNW